MLSRNVAGQKFVESVLTRKGGRSGWWGNLWKKICFQPMKLQTIMVVNLEE